MRVDIRPAGANQLNNLYATSGLKSITLTWTLPSWDPNYRGAEIWVNTVNDRETAGVFATVNANVFTYPINDTITRYFWVRMVDQYGRATGPFTGPAAAAAKLVESGDIGVFDLTTAQIVGKLAAGNIDGLGALALLNSLGVANISGLGALATQDAIAANAIGAGILAAGVIYAGIINASQVRADSLSAITATVGLLRTRETGGRVEIQSEVIALYDINNANRMLIGKTA